MDEFTKYNRQMLEENLPDYLFGKLSENDKSEFESELVKYPDLLKLSENLRITYSEINKDKFEKIAYSETLDMPGKVHFHLSRKRPNRNWQMISRSLFYAIPAAAVILIAYLILPVSFWNNHADNNSLKETNNLISFSDTDLSGLDDEYPLGLANEQSNKNNGFTKEEYGILDEYTEEFYAGVLKNESEKSIKQQIIPIENFDKSENSYIDLLNDNELQEILQEIENVNFKTEN
jgi:hypothetical protein